VWGLDPNWGGDPTVCGCGGCAACHAHATNKLFASVSDAGSGRAHTYCKCLVVPLALLDESVYKALFVDRGARASVDRRDRWVQAVLAQAPPVSDPTVGGSSSTGDGSGASASGPDTNSGPDTSSRPDTNSAPDTNSNGSPTVSDRDVQAVVGRVRLYEQPGRRRALYVEIDAAEAVTVTLAVVRRNATLARRTVGPVYGRHALKLVIPPNSSAGTARLQLRLQDAAGNSSLFVRTIQIPPRKKTSSARQGAPKAPIRPVPARRRDRSVA